MTNILKKKHQGKIWSLSPVNYVRDVYITTCDMFGDVSTDKQKPQHLVFHLPLHYLRSGATSICEFKLNDVTVPFIEMFCFYLHVIETCYDEFAENKQALFVENVRDTKNKCVAVRFHYFVQTENDKLKDIKSNIFEAHKKEFEKSKKKYQPKKKKREEIPIHKSFKRIHNNYTWTRLASNYMINSEVLSTTFKDVNQVGNNFNDYTRLQDVFSTDVKIFRGYYFDNGIEKKADICKNQGCTFINNKWVHNYIDDIGKYHVFPSSDDIIRVHPTEIFLNEIFIKQKYLLHYFMDTVLLPKIIIKSDTDDSIDLQENITTTSVIIPKNHIHYHVDLNSDVGTIDSFIKTLNGIESSEEIYIEKDLGNNIIKNLVWKHTFKTKTEDSTSLVEKIKETAKDFFHVCQEIYYDPQSPPCVFSETCTNQWFSIRNKYAHTSIGYLQWFTDTKALDTDPVEKQALTTKNSLDTLDYIKYEGAILKKKYPKSFKNTLLESFKSEIVDNVYAIVSEPLRHILDWGCSNKNHIVKRHKYRNWEEENDNWKNENVFTNSIKWKMNFFDNDLQVSTGHATLMLLNHAKYDAYRQTQDLHMNIIFTGEGATSKSFLFDQMKKMSIPGTVIELTYQTTKSDAIDEDRNDTITVFNEAPPGLFMKNMHADPNQEAMFKEKLTSQRVSCKTIVIDDETGLRTNRNTISSSIGVQLGATNDDPSDASEAMKTRFYWGQFEKNERKNKTMDACMRGEKMWNDIGESLLQSRLNDFHMEHFRMCILNKLMYIGAISEPTLSTSDIVYQKICEYLRKQKLCTSTRFKERYDIMCRIYTMIHAIDMVFNFELECNYDEIKCSLCNNCAQYNEPYKTPKFCIDCRKPNHVLYGNHYGKSFDVRQMKDVEPYLYCTEEIAIFTFTQISKEVYNPVEKKILAAFYKIWKEKQHAFKLNKSNGYEDPSNINYNVATLKVDSAKHLTKILSINIPIHVGRPSEHNIKYVLKQLQTRNITHRNFVQYVQKNNTMYDSSGSIESVSTMDMDNDPYDLEQMDLNETQEIKMKAYAKGDMLCTHDGNKTVTTDCLHIIDKDVEICTELFKQARIKESLSFRHVCIRKNCNESAIYSCNNSLPQFCIDHKPPHFVLYKEPDVIYKELDNDSILIKAVNNVQHKYTEKKHVIFGLPTYGNNGQIDNPNEMHETWVNPVDKIIEVKNPLYKTNKELHQMERTFLFEDENYYGQKIEMDLNEVACLNHFDRLYKNVVNNQEKDDKRFQFLELFCLDIQDKFKSIAKPVISVKTNQTYLFKYSNLKKRLLNRKEENQRKKKKSGNK